MLEVESKAPQSYAPFLERVLVLDGYREPARVLAAMLKELGAARIDHEISAKAALLTADRINPQIVFTEYNGPHWNGLDFVRTLRRSEFDCRQVPVIMVSEDAFAYSVLTARDAGVHEFLRKPFTLKDLVRRIEAVTTHERDWIEAVGYVGPDRRRFNAGEYTGERKRRTDQPGAPNAARLDQALRIVYSAMTALEEDPRQALRSLQAQAIDLARLAKAMDNPKLAAGAARLQHLLDQDRVLSAKELEEATRPLLAYLPPAWGQ